MIDAFRGEYRFLSNFWPCPIEWLGHTYSSTEAAFQAAKFAAYPEIVKEIQECKRPGDTKTVAAKYKHLIEPCWFIYSRELVMYHLLKQKFRTGSTLAAMLIKTMPHELVEGNTWNDTFWGVCNGIGENNLGKILMVIRHELSE